MNAEIETLLVDLDRADIKLWLDGEKLRFNAPENALTSELRERLQAVKPELMTRLQQANVDSSEKNLPFLQGDTIPPSFAQQHFGGLQLRNPSVCYYNVPFGFQLEGKLNVELLTQSFNRIIERHDFLRTTLENNNGDLQQIITPYQPQQTVVNMTVIHVDNLIDRATVLQKHLDIECLTPFNLAVESSLRVRLLQFSQNNAVLLLCVHNVLFDMGALRALLHELQEQYHALVTQQSCSLPALPMQYVNCVRWQRALLSESALQPRLVYWRKWFKRGEPPQVTFAIAGKNEPATTFDAGTCWCEISPELTQALKDLSQQTGVTFFNTILAAYALVLKRHSGYDDIVLGTTFANRNHWKLEPVIGSLLNILALRFDFTDNLDVISLLKRTRETVLIATEQQAVPFLTIAPFLFPDQPRTTPLFRTVFSFLGELSKHDVLLLENMQVTFMEDIHGAFMFPDLYPTIWERTTDEGGMLIGCWQYKRGFIAEETVKSMIISFQQILTAMVTNPTQTLDNL